MMKTQIMRTLLFFLLLTSVIFKSQNLSEAQKKQLFPFPTSAEAYSISKVEKLPIDYFRGKANVDIPIYTIKSGEISLPISLSYNTGGIKLNEVSSIVGLGWSLNIPGNIYQSIIGQDDFKAPFFSKNINDYSNYYGFVDVNSSTNQIRENLYSLMNNMYDTKPDIFEYTLSNTSGSFILNNNNDVFTIPNEDIKIQKQSNRFLLTDTQGTQYWMSPRNIVSTEYLAEFSMHQTLYNLDSIKANAKRIKFFYNKHNSYTERNFIEKANIRLTKDLPGYEPLHQFPKYEKTLSFNSNTEDLISKIEFDEGEVIFQYSNDSNLNFSDGSIYRKDINQNGIALRRILVLNKAGKSIKDVTLNYEYFESSNTTKDYEDYRLKLVSINDNLQNSNYVFTYDERYNIPKRNTMNDDYWGYINSINAPNEYGGNFPDIIRKEYSFDVEELNSIGMRNREPSKAFATLGSLKSIKYPTGARKNFYYELHETTTKEFLGYGVEGIFIDGIYAQNSTGDLGTAKNFEITNDHLLQAQNSGLLPSKVVLTFSNACDNADNQGHNGGIEPGDESGCEGIAIFGSRYFNAWRPDETLIDVSTGTGYLSLSKYGDCHCSLEVYLRCLKPIYGENKILYSGLRIRKIEDIDENNISNEFQYFYGKSQNGNFVPVANLKQPRYFSEVIDRRRKPSLPETPPYTQKIFSIHNNSQGNSSYGSSEIATYPFVIEKNGKGSVIMEFNDEATSYNNYVKWKNGKLLKEILLSSSNDTIKVTNYKYNINTIKNFKSGFLTNDSKIAAFHTNFDIDPVQVMGGEGYNVDHQTYFIESGKIQNTEIIEDEYLSNKVIRTEITKTYYDIDPNKPINLKSIISKHADNFLLETNYSYAHEKAKQKLIEANMVGIPLETTVVKKQTATDPGKTISKTETIYPDTLPDGQTGNLLLPKSVSALDMVTGNMSTELTYNQYDSKGNLQQYTAKNGISTAIVWGYNQTQPIAKVEGATYAQVSSLAAAIISASNDDAADIAVGNPKEQDLLNALDAFRNSSELSAYQITTYTYDPLIGVRSITPPSGVREVYIYDTANRLKEVKDLGGNVLKEYQYHYKP